jgi:hypothetical protein
VTSGNLGFQIKLFDEPTTNRRQRQNRPTNASTRTGFSAGEWLEMFVDCALPPAGDARRWSISENRSFCIIRRNPFDGRVIWFPTGSGSVVGLFGQRVQVPFQARRFEPGSRLGVFVRAVGFSLRFRRANAVEFVETLTAGDGGATRLSVRHPLGWFERAKHRRVSPASTRFS